MPVQRSSPFLTLEDPNAKIKGSRDPLGAQPIWAAFGRHVVTNVTAQSTSVRGFTTLRSTRAVPGGTPHLAGPPAPLFTGGRKF